MIKVLTDGYMGRSLYLYILITCFCALAHAQNDSLNLPVHVTTKEKTANFLMVYAAQWTYYLVVQKKEIEKYGEFGNWLNYPRNPHYDRDSFEYNLYRHTLAGQYYYLFYRSRDYSEQNAFIWSAISSFAFEFTIETVTERPSYQDLYQTPVYGTVLGVGVEKLSQALQNSETWLGHLTGYILNPFTLLPPTSEIIGSVEYHSDYIALQIGWEFE